MRRALAALAAAALCAAVDPASAVTFEPGDLVVTGLPYPLLPAAACNNQFCVVDPSSGAATPFAALPSFATYGTPRRLVVTSSTEVLALTDKALLRVNSETGVVTPIATGFTSAMQLATTPSGRVFVQLGNFPASVHEVNLTSGALTPYASDVRLATGTFGESLTLVGAVQTTLGGHEGYMPLLRRDLASGSDVEIGQLPLDSYYLDPPPALPYLDGGEIRGFAVGPEGDVFAFQGYSISITEGKLTRLGGPLGTLVLVPGGGDGQDLKDFCGSSFGAGSGGAGYLACSPGGPTGEGDPNEIQFWNAAGVRGSLDLDFAVGAIAVANVPEPTTALLLALGLAALARKRRG